MPSNCVRSSVACAARMSLMKALSVISSLRLDDARPVSSRMASISAIRSALANCRLDMFTHMTRGAASPNCFFQRAICRQDSVSVSRPISWIRPVASATPMNSAGLTNPRSGWRHRTSASNAVDAAGAEREDRLVVHLERALVDRLPEVGLELQARHRAVAHRRIEDFTGHSARPWRGGARQRRRAGPRPAACSRWR